MSVLLDANVLIALVVPDHVHHVRAERWFSEHVDGYATCPITQGSLVRLMMREGRPVGETQQVLRQLEADVRHQFWADDVSYTAVRMAGVVGHRQVTDAYLAQLARDRDSRLATFDTGLASLHQDVAELVPDTAR